MSQKYVHQMFESAAMQFPQNIAVYEQERRLSYQKLNQYASKLSLQLQNLGACPQNIIGVYLEAGIEYIVAVLGILKAKACFMPIGVNFPEKFITSIMSKTEPVIIITNENLAGKLIDLLSGENRPTGFYQIVVVSHHLETVSTETIGKTTRRPCLEPGENGSEGNKDDGCYIINTSGSTGTTKTIWGSHKGLCHFLQWEIDEFNLNHDIRVSLFSPVSFDVSLRDIFVPLLTGGSLCIPDSATRLDPRQLSNWLREQRISLTHMVPTLFRMLTRELSRNSHKENPLPDLRWILIAGEPLFGLDLQNWRKAVNGSRAELVNLYGPSETTLAKLFFRINRINLPSNEMVPVGKAIPDTQVLILDNNRLCSTGTAGEIHIKTIFASKGYYKDPERNSKYFIQNPLVTDKKDIIYRTGDYGEYLGNGIVKFIGRKDKQIKLQGKRIDMNQIEIHLRSHSLIRDCAVAPKTDTFGNQRLVAYLVLETDEKPAVEALKRYLGDKIHDYMIPSIFFTIKEMPLTHSGKINRNALPDPKHERPVLEQDFVLPANELQRKLCRIWREILCIDKVGIHDNFFDIGGTSLLSMVVSERIRDVLGVTIPVVKLFEYPQIYSLSKYLKHLEEDQPAFKKIRDRGTQRRRNIRRQRRNATM